MAGSFGHVVVNCYPQDGPLDLRLLDNQRLVRMLETGGDVYEAVTEMYGMIWALATLAQDTGEHPHLGTNPSAQEIVLWAREQSQQGLALSPGVTEEFDWLPGEEDE